MTARGRIFVMSAVYNDYDIPLVAHHLDFEQYNNEYITHATMDYLVQMQQWFGNDYHVKRFYDGLFISV